MIRKGFYQETINFKKIISKTLMTKIKFFKDDVYENSKRLNLNFGHTFAHAIEMTFKSNKGDILRHGEAVGMGMMCEIFFIVKSRNYGKNFRLVKELLKNYNLPTDLKNFVRLRDKKKILNSIYKNIFLDKKRISKFPRSIKISKIGNPKIIEMKNFEKIKYTIKKY